MFLTRALLQEKYVFVGNKDAWIFTTLFDKPKNRIKVYFIIAMVIIWNYNYFKVFITFLIPST